MRCVSYTQRASCCKDNRVSQINIADQNEHILSYAKGHGLRVIKKYTDRKSSPVKYTELEQVRIDGMNRSFDILIIDSLWQCGNDMYQAIRVLRDSLYPAGIQFVIVQNDFSSLEHSTDEVKSFFDTQWAAYSSHEAENRNKCHPCKLYIETFGYRYNRTDDRLEIDDESAGVIREIFEMLRQGRLPSDIAKELSDRGVENPGDYYCRTKGWALRGTKRGWNEGNVYNVARNPKFAGRWERVMYGKNYADDCGPIVSPEIFDEVQKTFESRRHHKLDCRKTENPFLKMMSDEETGAAVIMKKNKSTGIWDFHFQPPKPKGVCYEKTCILYQEAIKQMKEALLKEKRLALRAASFVNTDECIHWRDRLIEERQRTGRACFARLFNMMDPAPDIENNDIDAVAEMLTDLCEEIDNIKKSYSADNPWIKLFSEYDGDHDMTRRYLRKYVSHVNVYRFEKIIPLINEQEWKDRIITAVMEAEYGA